VGFFITFALVSRKLSKEQHQHGIKAVFFYFPKLYIFVFTFLRGEMFFHSDTSGRISMQPFFIFHLELPFYFSTLADQLVLVNHKRSEF